MQSLQVEMFLYDENFDGPVIFHTYIHLQDECLPVARVYEHVAETFWDFSMYFKNCKMLNYKQKL